ncbi:TetR/AcrR family transcriptional regulator [Gottfriedia acidiceleris]|uniref:TetR/AcrR family transcriptional regulator n=1 Tax=Gottfriedia acidiceleris TaxID=371036 RepID=A0ABY4JM74_9BACI|nr:TetR/AcrR family transcriptional regulator [Gottfriedia acidiceleris]UPM53837.1 TetR/AcrR family transcriptional regulator [Gottfriedia acidiceleris]
MEQIKRPLGRPPQDSKKKPTKTTIVENAVQLFLQNGYQLVSMDDVAMKCGVTKATVYYYYPTKADLFTDAMVQMMLRISDRIAEILSKDKSLKENLNEMVKVHLRATFEIDLKAFTKEAKVSLSDEQLQQMNKAEEMMYNVIEKAMETAIENGEIPKGNPKFYTQLFLAILSVGNFRDTDQNSIFSTIDEMAEHIIDFFWNGIMHNK